MKFINNEKGFALPAVLGIMLVISLLGTALWQYSISDTIHVSRDELRTQAYYVARAGADSALNAWLEAPSNSKPSGTSNVVAFSPGTFEATITQQNKEDSQILDWMKVESIGTVKDVNQKVTVLLTSNFKYGHDLGWYDYKSGQINSGEHDVYDGAVIIEAQNLKKLKEPNDPTAVFKATAMFFSSGIGIPFNDSLALHAETIVFYDNPIKMNKGELILFLFDGKGITREDESGLWGRVFFWDVYDSNNNLIEEISRKAFYFPATENGIDITVLEDRALLDEIEEPVVPSPDIYHDIIWS
ncbi:MAG: hypothetical protein VR67_01675 [Peptococcaceae bacterium BRH_c8a]|nr:MAG: hypothetical protein VR67_01675 [Peptococcaceae bacterium BRH_c8a]